MEDRTIINSCTSAGAAASAGASSSLALLPGPPLHILLAAASPHVLVVNPLWMCMRWSEDENHPLNLYSGLLWSSASDPGPEDAVLPAQFPTEHR